MYDDYSFTKEADRASVAKHLPDPNHQTGVIGSMAANNFTTTNAPDSFRGVLRVLPGGVRDAPEGSITTQEGTERT